MGLCVCVCVMDRAAESESPKIKVKIILFELEVKKRKDLRDFQSLEGLALNSTRKKGCKRMWECDDKLHMCV